MDCPVKTHSFDIRFLLPSAEEDEPITGFDTFDRLYEGGLDDALVGFGNGTYRADFDRESVTLAEAVGSALGNIQTAFPDAVFLSIGFPTAVG
jgi:hypothetical protein